MGQGAGHRRSGPGLGLLLIIGNRQSEPDWAKLGDFQAGLDQIRGILRPGWPKLGNFPSGGGGAPFFKLSSPISFMSLGRPNFFMSNFI